MQKLVCLGLFALILTFAFILFSGCDMLQSKAQGEGSKEGTSDYTYKLPFPVKVGGQSAVENMNVCASIPNPIEKNAEIEIGAEMGGGDQVIVNAFESDDKGNPLDQKGQNATIIIFNGKKGTMDKKMSNTPDLKSGTTYVMNIVAKGQTARVFFKVK